MAGLTDSAVASCNEMTLPKSAGLRWGNAHCCDGSKGSTRRRWVQMVPSTEQYASTTSKSAQVAVFGISNNDAGGDISGAGWQLYGVG